MLTSRCRRVVCLLLSWAAVAGAAERIIVTGFEPSNTVHVNAYRNASKQIISAGSGKHFPEGTHALRVCVGGVRDIPGGGVSIFLPEAAQREDATAISAWIKGAPDNAGKIVLKICEPDREYHTWRGPANRPASQIAFSRKKWVRFEFPLNEFRKRQKTPDDRKGLKGIPYIAFAGGLLWRTRGWRESNEFLVDKIEVVCGREREHQDEGLDPAAVSKAESEALSATWRAAVGERVYPLPDAESERLATMVRGSLEVLDARGVVLIPTPKQIRFVVGDLRVPTGAIGAVDLRASSDAARDYLTKRFKTLGAPRALAEPEARKARVRIDVRTKAAEGVGLKPPDKPEGYAIATRDEDGVRTFDLVGTDRTGALYAVVTLAALIQRVDDALIFPKVEVRDWPDMRYRQASALKGVFRAAFRRKDPVGMDVAEAHVDWLVRHKFNLTYGPRGTGGYGAAGDPRTLSDPARLRWLRHVTDYALARGIRVVLPNSFAVGNSRTDKANPEYKHCIDHRGGLYTWADDKLLDRKVDRLIEFCRKSGVRGGYFHSIDTRNSRWGDRSDLERRRFGDDRMTADANVINRFYRIRQALPDFQMQIVGRPYTGNLDRVEWLIHRGELARPNDFQRLSRMIPTDVSMCLRECNRASFLSWKRAFRQNILLYLATGNARIRQRRFLSMNVRAIRTWYTHGNRDTLWMVGGSWPHMKMNFVAGSEFCWNVYSPGHVQWDAPDSYDPEPKSNRREPGLMDIFDTFRSRDVNRPLWDLVRRACVSEFGPRDGPHFEKVYASLIDYQLPIDVKEMQHRLSGVIQFTRREQRGVFSRMYRDCDTAVRSMVELKNRGTERAFSKFMADYFHGMVALLRAWCRIRSLCLSAELAGAADEENTTRCLTAACGKAWAEEAGRLPGIWEACRGGKPAAPLPATRWLAQQIEAMRNEVRLSKVRALSRFELGPTTVPAPAAQVKNAMVRVGVFDPRPAGGVVYGVDGLLATLKTQLDLDLVSLPYLTAESLANVDCLIVPDCKRVGRNATLDLKVLRDYVIRGGGGIYFEHDSCGYFRFPLKASAFPEAAVKPLRFGQTPAKKEVYNPEDRRLVVAENHPITQGLPKGFRYTHAYYDHFQMVLGPRGKAVVRDRTGAPVVVVSELGRGRVCFSGCLTYHIDDRELARPLRTPETQIIIQAIHWLARQSGTEIRLRNVKKVDRVLPDGTYSIITFTPEVIPTRDLTDVTLTAECRHPGTGRLLARPQTIARVAEMSGPWTAGEAVRVECDEYKTVLLTLCLQSRQGERAVHHALTTAPVAPHKERR